MKNAVICFLLVAMVGMGGGCTAFRRSVSERSPEDGTPMTAKYDQRDLLAWGEIISKDILDAPFPSGEGEQPILVDMGIQNRTKSHIDMKTLSDTVTTKLLDSGKIRLVNASRRDDLLREQSYQLENVTPETRLAIGKQLGARYMLTGSLSEIEVSSGRQVRVSKKQDVYYQLTVEITDLETGLIALRKQRDRLRRISKPLIGW